MLRTEVGYIGGNKENITYEECCTGETNACEAIIVKFDEKIISYKEKDEWTLITKYNIGNKKVNYENSFL